MYMNKIQGHHVVDYKPYNELNGLKYVYYRTRNHNKLTIILTRKYYTDWKVYSNLLNHCHRNDSIVLVISYKDFDMNNIINIISDEFVSLPLFIMGRKQSCGDSVNLANFLFSNNFDVKNVCQIENSKLFLPLSDSINTLIINTSDKDCNTEYSNYDLINTNNISEIKNYLNLFYF